MAPYVLDRVHAGRYCRHVTTELRKSVALSILSLLAASDRSERWLAERSGIEYELLQEKLHLRVDFTVTDLADIARALGVPVADLVPRLNSEDRADADADVDIAHD